MSKENKKGLVPARRFPEFEDAGEWEEATLEDIARYRRGSFPQPYGLPEWYDDENGMPFIQVFDVSDDMRLKPDTKRKISKAAAEQSVFIEQGTVIITIQGSIGRVAITQYDAYIDRTLLLFQEFLQSIEKTFFVYTIQILFELERLKAPGGIIKTITKEALSSFIVKLPSISEQQKIADCLSSLDELIAVHSKKLKELQSWKKGLMQNLFPAEGKTVPALCFPEFEDAGEWESKPLGKIGAFTGGGTPRKSESAYWKGDIPWVSSSDISEESIRNISITRFITKEAVEQSATKLVPENSILLVSRVGVGKLAVSIKAVCTSQDFTNFTSDKDNIYFLAYFLKANSESLLSFSQGMAIKGFTKEDISKLDVLFPKIEEQQKIADCLSSVDELVTVQSQKIEDLKAHKKGLMQQLFPNTEAVGA